MRLQAPDALRHHQGNVHVQGIVLLPLNQLVQRRSEHAVGINMHTLQLISAHTDNRSANQPMHLILCKVVLLPLAKQRADPNLARARSGFSADWAPSLVHNRHTQLQLHESAFSPSHRD